MFSALPTKVASQGKIEVDQLFEIFGVDFVGPFNPSKRGNLYIIVAVEYYTNWPIASVIDDEIFGRNRIE